MTGPFFSSGRIGILFALLLLTFSAPAFAWTGKVTGVADGDTITVLHDGRSEKIRLHGIDTPERQQAYGNKAKALTNSMVRGRTVEVKPQTVDRYGRTVALVYVDGQSLNELLIQNGYAWVYRKYCKDSFCSDWSRLEEQARNQRKGMWQDASIVPPWEWRHSGQTAAPLFASSDGKQSGEPSTGGVFHGNVSSMKFHAPGCKAYNCKNCTASFPSREAALAAGYTPCKLCKPQ
jgi:endonuclease YncB( thermonuclease family)